MQYGVLNIGDLQIDVSLHIYNVSVPKKESFRLINWTSVEDMGQYHDVELWSDEH